MLSASRIPQGSVELRRFRGRSYPYIKVTLGRLVKRGMAFKVKRGVYFIPSPENLAKLHALGRANIISKIVRSIYAEFHRHLKLILIYGSYARGDFDERSDVDVLVVADRGAPSLPEELSRRFGRRVDIKILSPAYFKKLMVIEPKVHFWLREGIVFDEAGITKDVCPIGKIGVYEALRNAETQLELSRSAAALSRKGYHLLAAIRELLTLKHAIALDFDYRNVRAELRELVGESAVEKLRSMGRAKVTGEEVRSWKKLAGELHRELKHVYQKLGENLGDMYLKKLMGRGRE